MPRGRKYGGRTKGARNKSTLARLEAEGDSGRELPLDYMLRVMRDKNASESRRDGMARAAAPYLHPRLDTAPSVGLTLNNDKDSMMRIEFVLPDPRPEE